jgi:hypothetical protein
MQFHWRVIRRAACFGAVLVLLGAATGCGGKAKVSGAVTLDGKPLPLGRISFTPASGPPGVTADIQDGKYTAEDVRTGENKVSVETAYIELEANLVLHPDHPGGGGGTGGGGAPMPGMPPEAVAGMAEMNKGRGEGIKHAKENLEKYRKIPEKFNNPQTSGLSLTVKSGDNSFPVDLSK